MFYDLNIKVILGNVRKWSPVLTNVGYFTWCGFETDCMWFVSAISFDFNFTSGSEIAIDLFLAFTKYT